MKRKIYNDAYDKSYGWISVDETPIDEDGIWVAFRGKIEDDGNSVWLKPVDAERFAKRILRVVCKAKKQKPTKGYVMIAPTGPF